MQVFFPAVNNYWTGGRAFPLGTVGIQVPSFLKIMRKDLEMNNKERKFIYT